MSGLLYADDLVLCGESEEDLRVMVEWFDEVCRRKGLKVNAGKSKVMALNGEEGLECEVHIDRIRLKHFSEFKYLGFVLDKSGIDEVECCRRVPGAIRSQVNARDLQLQCVRVLLETWFTSICSYVWQ